MARSADLESQIGRATPQECFPVLRVVLDGLRSTRQTMAARSRRALVCLVAVVLDGAVVRLGLLAEATAERRRSSQTAPTTRAATGATHVAILVHRMARSFLRRFSVSVSMFFSSSSSIPSASSACPPQREGCQTSRETLTYPLVQASG